MWSLTWDTSRSDTAKGTGTQPQSSSQNAAPTAPAPDTGNSHRKHGQIHPLCLLGFVLCPQAKKRGMEAPERLSHDLGTGRAKGDGEEEAPGKSQCSFWCLDGAQKGDSKFPQGQRETGQGVLN